MTYVDAKRIGDVIYVAECNNGQHKVRSFPAPYYFYVDDPAGQYKSMYGNQVSRVDCRSYNDFQEQIEFFREQHIKTHESDVNVVYKLLEKEYCDAPVESLNVLFTDIETETDPTKGFADYSNPYGAINAITNHLGWLGITKTYARIPPSVTMEEALEMVKDIPNVYLFETDDEKGILDGFYSDIEDASVITGWNSNGYDLPYIIQRTRVVYGKELPELIGGIDYFDPNEESMIQLIKFSPFDFQLPLLKKVEFYGKERPTFQLTGRIHLDYLDLYRKFSMSELHSYKLDYVLQHEINENKVAYDGTLDDLWKNDFRKFIQYSIQDVNGLVKLDKKKKFIDLASDMAHEACVSIKEALGSVTIIEQAILVLLHKKGLIAPDKAPAAKGKPVAGAFVHEPIGGMYDWITSFDINSLYPSVIRMLNISPESFIGQFDIRETENELDRLVDQGFAKDRTAAWGHFTGVLEYHHIADTPGEKLLTMETPDGGRITLTSQEWNDFFREEDMCVTANGTVFDQKEQGIVPYALQLWYSQRKVFQKNQKQARSDAVKFLEARGKKVG